MKTNSCVKLNIFTIAGIACIIGIYSIFNYKGIDTRKAKTEISLTANELLKDLNEEDEKQFEQYIEKALEIDGTIYQITYKAGKYSLLLRGDKIDALVLCEMEKDQAPLIELLKVGDEVKVKGILKGFLMDAILLNCIVLEEVNE